MVFRSNPSDILYQRKVLVIGFGRQGQALARWLPTTGAQVIVTDSRHPDALDVDLNQFQGVRFVLGDHPIELLDEAEMICVSGGVSLDMPLLQLATYRGIPITNDAQLFVSRSPAPVTGITGSAGKTTTTTLVGEMCKKAGFTTWVGGNIGNVLLDVMIGIQPHHQVIMELSSFQLELMIASPTVSAILNLTPNHLDRHGTMQNYIFAKSNILNHQGADDIAVLNYDDLTTRLMSDNVSGHRVWFSMNEIMLHGSFILGEQIVITGLATQDDKPHVLCDIADIQLRGQHNIANVLAACAIAGTIGVPPEAMVEVIRTFGGVPYRQEVVRVHQGVTYVNDSIATAPERVLAALKSYDEPLVLLLGGADKKLTWSPMIELALKKCRHIIAFGRDGDIVINTAQQLGHDNHNITRVNTLDEAVEKAVAVAQAGDVVLLSPGGTSYDAYRDFAERGEHFRRLVLAI